MEHEFKIGEKIALLDEDTKGVIKAINGDKITFESEDGFLYKCHPKEIVTQETAREALSEFIKDKDWQYVSNDKFAERRGPTPSTYRHQREVPPRILDLHIEKLLRSTRGMSSGDIIDHQMRYARAAVENARSSGAKKIVFIHGVGAGVLKEELGYMLKGYPKCRYYDAAYHLYGEGAMEVEFL